MLNPDKMQMGIQDPVWSGLWRKGTRDHLPLFLSNHSLPDLPRQFPKDDRLEIAILRMLHRRKGAKTMRYYISILSGSDDWDPVLAVAGVLTIGEIEVNGISDMVERLEGQVGPYGRIGALDITGHGNNQGMFIGRDFLSLRSLPQHRMTLSRLTTLFDRDPLALVTLGGCNVGKNGPLLLALSRLWDGVRVRAFTARQRPVVPGHQGGEQVCWRNNHSYGCTFSGWGAGDYIDSMLGQD